MIERRLKLQGSRIKKCWLRISISKQRKKGGRGSLGGKVELRNLNANAKTLSYKKVTRTKNSWYCVKNATTTNSILAISVSIPILNMMSLSTRTLSITIHSVTLSIKGLYVPLSINDTQHINALP